VRGIGELVPREQQRGAGIVQVVADLALLEQHVHRDDRCAQPQRAVVARREVRDVRQHDPHAVTCLHALGAQQTGDAGGDRLELGVGRDPVVELDRHTLGVRGRASAEEMGDVGHDPQRMGPCGAQDRAFQPRWPML
jgi:hypothetical protein